MEATSACLWKTFKAMNNVPGAMDGSEVFYISRYKEIIHILPGESKAIIL
jgi:hypothetical protein